MKVLKYSTIGASLLFFLLSALPFLPTLTSDVGLKSASASFLKKATKKKATKKKATKKKATKKKASKRKARRKRATRRIKSAVKRTIENLRKRKTKKKATKK